jgi:thiol-disulfide isomerase/thioredoxin
MPDPRNKRRSRIALVLGVIVIGLLFAFKAPIQQKIMLNSALRQPAASAELIEELASTSSDPVEVYRRFWATGKIPHRLAALRAYNRGRDLTDEDAAPAWVHDAAMDSDFHVRELALGILAAVRDPDLEKVVHAWLLDPDPELKRLALRQARTSGFTNLSHTVAPLLQHPDLDVRIAAATTFRNWTDKDFGVRQTKLIGTFDEVSGTYSGEDAAKREQVETGLKEWSAWWADSGNQMFAEVAITAAPGRTEPLPAPDFQLPDLDGKLVHLSDLRGKPVLLNFWATWCTACWTEIPDLIALHNRLGDRLTIIGISLDGLPDQHALDHGHSDVEGAPHADDHGEELAKEELVELVGGFVKKHGMNYPVLLDPDGITSELYAGNELPMNVLIDANGNVYRRFMGSRSKDGFEAMLKEILPK